MRVLIILFLIGIGGGPAFAEKTDDAYLIAKRLTDGSEGGLQRMARSEDRRSRVGRHRQGDH